MPAEGFKIYQVAGFGSGTLGLCKQPNIDADFTTVAAWHPSVVVTLTHEDEFPKAGIFLPQRFLEADFNWLHLPITDFGVPAAKDRALWQESLAQLLDILNAGGRVLTHCKGGNGRSGMLVLKLLTGQGEDGDTALQRIRLVRSGAVETQAQYTWATKPLSHQIPAT